MSALPFPQWTFTQPSPFGEQRTRVEFHAEALHCLSDGLAGPRDLRLRWDDIVEGATAVLERPEPRRRRDAAAAHTPPPPLPFHQGGRLEWLLLSRREGAAVMHPLPDGEARDALVAALQQRLGTRWVGERLPLATLRERFRLSSRRELPRLIALVLTVLALLALMLLVFGTAASLLMPPAGVLLGALTFRRGLIGLRDTLQMAHTPPSRVVSAAIGQVELEGRVVAAETSPAGASGRPSVWWDVTVDVWSDASDDGGWKPALQAHGGRIDQLVLEDDTGRMPVWLRGADLLLEEHVWESGRDALPPHGVAWLAGTHLPWQGGERLRVRETRMEAGATLYVHGRLDEARHLAIGQTWSDRLLRPLRDGTWRRTLLARLPSPLRLPLGVALAYVELLWSGPRAGERRHGPEDAPLPALPPETLVVWRGRGGHSLLVSDRRESEALAQLRRRSCWAVGIGIALICLCLHEWMSL